MGFKKCQNISIRLHAYANNDSDNSYLRLIFHSAYYKNEKEKDRNISRVMFTSQHVERKNVQ